MLSHIVFTRIPIRLARLVLQFGGHPIKHFKRKCPSCRYDRRRDLAPPETPKNQDVHSVRVNMTPIQQPITSIDTKPPEQPNNNNNNNNNKKVEMVVKSSRQLSANLLNMETNNCSVLLSPCTDQPHLDNNNCFGSDHLRCINHRLLNMPAHRFKNFIDNEDTEQHINCLNEAYERLQERSNDSNDNKRIVAATNSASCTVESVSHHNGPHLDHLNRLLPSQVEAHGHLANCLYSQDHITVQVLNDFWNACTQQHGCHNRVLIFYLLFRWIFKRYVHIEPCSSLVRSDYCKQFKERVLPQLKMFVKLLNPRWAQSMTGNLMQVQMLVAIESLYYNERIHIKAIAEVLDLSFKSNILEACSFVIWCSLQHNHQNLNEQSSWFFSTNRPSQHQEKREFLENLKKVGFPLIK